MKKSLLYAACFIALFCMAWGGRGLLWADTETVQTTTIRSYEEVPATEISAMRIERMPRDVTTTKTRVETVSKTSETKKESGPGGVVSGTTNLAGGILALPFHVAGGLIEAVF